ncbi:MAG: hypothetical protein RB296_12570 [Acidobacteriota bacterium]|jgi:hypothetical protein|nr:hypothetical protein [Acidobacteriota bacterium]
MKLNAPKKIVWWISVILAVVSIVSIFVVIPFMTVYAFWIMAVAWLLLFLGTWLKGF